MFFFHPWREKSSHRAGEIQIFTLESHACQSKWMSMLYTFFDDSCKYQHFLSYPQKWQFQIRHPYKGAESTGCLVYGIGLPSNCPISAVFQTPSPQRRSNGFGRVQPIPKSTKTYKNPILEGKQHGFKGTIFRFFWYRFQAEAWNRSPIQRRFGRRWTAHGEFQFQEVNQRFRMVNSPFLIRSSRWLHPKWGWVKTLVPSEPQNSW